MNARHTLLSMPLALLTAVVLVACEDTTPDVVGDGGSDDGGSDDGGVPFEDCGDYEDNDGDGLVDCDDVDDCEGEVECPIIDPVALGFDLDAGWQAESGELLYYIYSGDTSAYSPVVTLRVTDLEYFNFTSTDDPDINNHFCDFYAEFIYEQVDPLPLGYGFDYEADHGGNGLTYPLFWFAEGYASIFNWSVALDSAGNPVRDENGDYVASRACQSLFDQGYPDAIDGMHLGIGFGDLTPRILDWFSDFEGDYAPYEPATVTAFIAMNHPSDSEPDGYDFKAYDWNAAFSFAGAIETTTLTDSEGNGFEADVFIADVDGTSLVFGEAGEDALIRTSSTWYEDYPNFELDLLKLGVPDGLR